MANQSSEVLVDTFGDTQTRNHLVGRVVMVYEDLKAGLNGKRFVEQLQGRLFVTPRFNISEWRCDLFREPLLREQAVFEACEADVVVLSVQGKKELPTETREWLERWLDEKDNRHCALGILFNQIGVLADQDNPVITYILGVAKEAGADLYVSYAHSITKSELAFFHRTFPAAGNPLLFDRSRKNSKDVRQTCR